MTNVKVSKRSNTAGRPATLPPYVISNEEMDERLLINVEETAMEGCDFEIGIVVGCKITPDSLFPGKIRLAALNYMQPAKGNAPRKVFPAFTGMQIDIDGKAYDLQLGLDLAAILPGALKGATPTRTETDATTHQANSEATNKDPEAPDAPTA